MVPALLALMPLKETTRLSRLLWVMLGASMVFLIGLRFQVGADLGFLFNAVPRDIRGPT